MAALVIFLSLLLLSGSGSRSYHMVSHMVSLGQSAEGSISPIYSLLRPWLGHSPFIASDHHITAPMHLAHGPGWPAFFAPLDI